jgi:hypothetical protein
VRTARAALVILALAAMAFALAARRGPYGSVEVQPQPPPAERSAEPTPTSGSFEVKLPPPTEAEVEGGLRRAFGESVRPATKPRNCIVGDFNGDGAEDVAMPVRPAEGRLHELNDAFANWTVQDALDEAGSGTEPSPNATRAPPTVEPGDVLLAVVHGFGPQGWRDDRARQCYLVRHATGAPLEARPRTELLRYVARVPDAAQLTGHVILSTVGRRPGFVYWTGARYTWHPLPSLPRAPAAAP